MNFFKLGNDLLLNQSFRAEQKKVLEAVCLTVEGGYTVVPGSDC